MELIKKELPKNYTYEIRLTREELERMRMFIDTHCRIRNIPIEKTPYMKMYEDIRDILDE